MLYEKEINEVGNCIAKELNSYYSDGDDNIFRLFKIDYQHHIPIEHRIIVNHDRFDIYFLTDSDGIIINKNQDPVINLDDLSYYFTDRVDEIGSEVFKKSLDKIKEISSTDKGKPDETVSYNNLDDLVNYLKDNYVHDYEHVGNKITSIIKSIAINAIHNPLYCHKMTIDQYIPIDNIEKIISDLEEWIEKKYKQFSTYIVMHTENELKSLIVKNIDENGETYYTLKDYDTIELYYVMQDYIDTFETLFDLQK